MVPRVHIIVSVGIIGTLEYLGYVQNVSLYVLNIRHHSCWPNPQSVCTMDSMIPVLELNGAKVRNIWFLSPLAPSKWENLVLLSFATFWIFFWGGSVFIFQFDIIVNFIIQKLKNKHTFLKKLQNWAKLSKTKFSRFEETRGDKNQMFRT